MLQKNHRLIFCSFCAFCLVVISNIALAQRQVYLHKIDSLLKLDAKYAEQDSIKLVIYNKLISSYLAISDLKSAKPYIDKAIKQAKLQNRPFLIGDVYYHLGFYYHNLDKYLEAEDYYYKSIGEYTKANSKLSVAEIYQNLSAMYVAIPDYVKALESNFKAIKLFNETNEPTSVAACYVNIAGVYDGLGQHGNAIDYLKMAISIFVEYDDTEYGVALSYVNMSEAYLKASDADLKKLNLTRAEKYKKVLEYLSKAEVYATKINVFSMLGSIYTIKGNTYKVMGDKDKAVDAFEKALVYNNKLITKTPYAKTLVLMAEFYDEEKKIEKAERLLLEAIKVATPIKNLSVLRDANLLLSKLNEQQGEFISSLAYFKAYISFKEQIIDQEKEKEITRKQLQLDFSIKENNYQAKQKLTDVKLEKQLVLARERQQQLVLKQQELALSDKEKNIQRLTFLQKQTDLENDKLLQANKLKEQQLTLQLTKAQKDKQIHNQLNEIKLNRNISIFFGVLALVLLGAALLVFKAQRKAARLNKIVLKQKVELEKLGKVKDRIFSVVSHDMRTPVNSLISFIQLLDDGQIDQARLTKYAAQLKSTLGYTSSMMENLLNWASSQMQGFKPAFQNFDIQLCVQEVIDSLKDASSLKSITIKNAIVLQTICFADYNMSSLVLRNLISNAIKFTPKNGSIEITSSFVNNKVSIAVTDNGVGMSAIQLSAFNKQGQNETGQSTLGTNKEKGTGIGLVLCKTFTKLMNGSIYAESQENGGSKFVLTLPLP